MSHNTFGYLFRVTTWGESHGPAIGGVVDGCPPGIRFKISDIQAELDRRRLPWAWVEGDGDARLESALAAIAAAGLDR